VIDSIGFVGLGAMGAPMARRLHQAGVPLVVWTRAASRLREFEQLGMSVASSPAEVAASCRIVLSCLLNDEAIKDVYLTDDGLLAESVAESVFLDHGTFTPALARRLDAAARTNGCRFIDAPVSGGVVGAVNGTLTCMVGGDQDDVNRLRPLIAHYARSVDWVGPVGTGLELKLVNQMLVAAHALSSAEAAALVSAMDLPVETASRVLNAGWGASTMLGRNLLPSLTGRYPDEGATIEHLLEVLGVLRAVIAGYELDTVIEPMVLDRFQDAVRAGYGSLDLSAMVEVYRPADRRGRLSEGGLTGVS
jgi:3-hydroxyisobutyrate dehydrogenase-like beta-hydroxyacid dehydrogenase